MFYFFVVRDVCFFFFHRVKIVPRDTHFSLSRLSRLSLSLCAEKEYEPRESIRDVVARAGKTRKVRHWWKQEEE
jgi:hypothetical protein